MVGLSYKPKRDTIKKIEVYNSDLEESPDSNEF